MKSMFCALAGLALAAGCAEATQYDTGVVVLDVSDPEAFNSKLETSDQFLGAYEALKSEDLPRAEALLTEALEMKPRDPYALLAMGAVMERTGRYYSAADYYRSAIRYGNAAAGPKLEGGREIPLNRQMTVADIARTNLAQLEN